MMILLVVMGAWVLSLMETRVRIPCLIVSELTGMLGASEVRGREARMAETLSEVIGLAQAMVRVDTSNPPGQREAETAHLLGEYLAGRGLEITYQEIEPGRANLVARLRGKTPTGALVLCGHMDVVPAVTEDWQIDPFAGEIVGGRLIGRGSADMKGGLAAMAVALARLAESGETLEADVILAATISEERLALGAKRLAESRVLEGAGMLVIGEPTSLNIATAQRGGRGWLLTAHGTPAHSSTPHLGVNAISFMARLALALEVNPFPFTPHPLLGDAVVCVSGIQSWPPTNIVPARCDLGFHVRVVPGQTQAALDARLQEVIEEVSEESGLRVNVEIETVTGVDALETDPEHLLVRTAGQAVREVTGRMPTLFGFSGGTDAATLVPAYHLPMAILGPGDLAVAHQVDEAVSVAEVEAAVEVYGTLARMLVSSAGATGRT
jgi:succinyl-diaminopimelate desuccinylase